MVPLAGQVSAGGQLPFGLLVTPSLTETQVGGAPAHQKEGSGIWYPLVL